MNDRKCIVCGTPINGRPDKKFCSERCRYFKNNKIRAEDKLGVYETNRILTKNRNILKKLCPYGHATVRKSIMDSLGFEPALFTSFFITGNKQVYYLCYDYGFTPLIVNGIKKALIVTRQAYMTPIDPWKYTSRKNSDGTSLS